MPYAGMSLAALYRPTTNRTRPGFEWPSLDASSGPDYPAEPKLPESVRDLSAEEQKRIRRERILAVLSQGLSQQRSGRMGEAMLAASLESGGMEEQAVQEARRRALANYQAQRQAADDAWKQQEKARTAESYNRKRSVAEGLYAEIEQEAADDPAFIAQARAAAASGDLESLGKLRLGVSERANSRRAMKAAGVNPDDPIQVETWKRQRSVEDEVAKEKALRSQGLGRYEPPEPRQDYWTTTTLADGSVWRLNPRTGEARPIEALGAGARPTKGGSGKSDAELWESAVDWAARVKNGSNRYEYEDRTTEQLATEKFNLLKKGPPGSNPPSESPAGAAPAGAGDSEVESALRELESLDPTTAARVRRSIAAGSVDRNALLSDLRAGIAARRGARR